MPLGEGGEAPPAELRRAVAELLGDAGLGPVVLLHTRRLLTALRAEDGRQLAEVADDTVRAETRPATPGGEPEVRTWREVEVELGAGDEALLAAVGDRLVAAGARPSPRASKLATALGSRLSG
ncbi:hypothetical protein [Blastococcus sp. TF02A-35]|uniref:hypothetical protein n=1 Tax=Blastococcus sp. TF02A-35 TaxID=2559612 RepID=UPI00107314E9|nr:hypothetical protein [Blastococcus sp. TF02A_35]TFV46001.1 hypothetical protein E4P43_16955 [Blastococcus sp. TF02A_35]